MTKRQKQLDNKARWAARTADARRPEWVPGESGNPSGVSADIEQFRLSVRADQRLRDRIWEVALDRDHDKQLDALKFLLAQGYGMPEGANRATQDVIDREVERRLQSILAEAQRKFEERNKAAALAPMPEEGTTKQ